MKRPFVTLCIFLLIGIIIAYSLNYYTPMHYIIYGIILSLIVLLFFEKLFILIVAFVFTLLGTYIYGQNIIGDKLLDTALDSTVIQAKVTKEGIFKKGFKEYDIEIIGLIINQNDEIIKLNKKAKLNLYPVTKEQSLPLLNNIIKINNSNTKPLMKDKDNINLNSYELFLMSQGIEYILESNLENISIDNSRYFKNMKLNSISYKTKMYIEDFLDSTLDFENSEILKSIVFGNQGYLSKDRLSIFSKTGTAHIMAVSGLHIGLIVLIVEQFLQLMRVGRNNRLYITIVILIFYGYMVNFPVSIVRAGAMYCLYVISYFFERRYDSINSLFFIAFILLLYRPMTIFSISFQLSFMATLSILLISPILNKFLSKRIGILGSLISITLAAQIGTLPIMAYHFKQISIISVVSNLLIVPLLGPMLTIGFVSILLGLISFRLGFLINQITNQLLSYINWISIKCAIIPYSSIEIDQLKLKYIFGYYITLGVIYFIYNSICKEKQKKNLSKEGLVNIYDL